MARIHGKVLKLSKAFDRRFLAATRIEPRCRSRAAVGQGLEARVADPLWMLARQWQMGEFIGVLTTALCIGSVVLLLHKVYGIGSPTLPAPQATLMSLVIKGKHLDKITRSQRYNIMVCLKKASFYQLAAGRISICKFMVANGHGTIR